MDDNRRRSFLALAERLTDALRARKFPYFEVHIVQASGSSLLLQDGKLERSALSTGEGVCLRVYTAGTWVMTSTDSLLEDEALGLVREVERLAVGASGREELDFGALPPGEDVAVEDQFEISPDAVSPAEKVALLRRLSEEAVKAGDERIVNHGFTYSDGAGAAAVATSRGGFVYSERSRVMLGCSVIARDGDTAQRWSERAGGIGGFERVRSVNNEDFGIKAVREALALLKAPSGPSGKMPVILDPSVTGLFIHECLGHNAEADLVLEGQSLLDNKMGKVVASPIVTVVDDPTLKHTYGHYLYDAEGFPARPVTIIRDGVLVEYLHSLETALRMRAAPNGHARHSSFAARPLPRMSNTYIAPGKMPIEDLIASVEKGVLLCRGESGHVFSEKGEYECRAETGYIIEKGKLGERIRETPFTGRVLDTLKRVSGLGSELVLDDPGLCGKEGQEVAVDSGGPHVLVSEVVVGGLGAGISVQA